MNSSAVGPLVANIILSGQQSSSGLGLVLKAVEIDKYGLISTCVNSLQHLLVGLFLLGFTPKYKEMVAKFICGTEPENAETVPRPHRHRYADEGNHEFIECPGDVGNQAKDAIDNFPHCSARDKIDKGTVSVNVEVHVRPDGVN